MAATAEALDAERALARGLAVFDLPSGSKRPSPGWQQRATRDRWQMHRWLAAGYNLGVGCRASGVLGLDLDRHDNGADGLATFARWCRAQGQDWPQTLTVATPNHGLHLYFHVPTDVILPSTSGGRSGLGPGIDTRGPGRRSGGYLLAPGSTIDGRRYRIDTDVPITEMPRWLMQILTPRRDRTTGDDNRKARGDGVGIRTH